jgi:class 3 adenylate cyclase
MKARIPMAWDEQRARDRIRKFKNETLSQGIDISGVSEFFEARAMDPEFKNKASSRSLVSIPYNKAIKTHGVHIYAKLTGFDRFLATQSDDFERLDAQMLAFLHSHYSSSDRLIDAFELQRVDYHGGRLHAVVLAQDGSEEGEADRVAIAIAFADRLQEIIARVSNAGDVFNSGVRIGIDSGAAIAINGGRGNEQDPIFVGDAANAAAKLAEGDDPGIFYSERVRKVLSGAGSRFDRSGFLVEADRMENLAKGLNFNRSDGLPFEAAAAAAIENLNEETLVGYRNSVEGFRFRRFPPPLSSITFADLMPSNTVRMEMAGILADVHNYTRFVHGAMESGKIGHAVGAIHLIRWELNQVLNRDHGGKRIRYIGDAIHGVAAKGTESSINESDTVKEMVLTAGAMRSSFAICQAEFGGIESLDLAVAFESGTQAITRLGIRGDRSVRCAAGRILSSNEALMKKSTEGNETYIGESAFNVASAKIQHEFRNAGGAIPNLDYEVASELARSTSSSIGPSTGSSRSWSY